MSETPNYGLYVTPPDDTTTNLIQWMQLIDGTASMSNMMKIDNLIASLEAAKSNKIIESDSEPEGMVSGDEWDRLL